jgi:sulfur-oxidizing protein SoxA
MPSLRILLRLVCMLLGAALHSATAADAGGERPSPLKSGIEFTSGQVRALQRDDVENPGMLWVTRGESMWQTVTGTAGQSCAGCHQRAETSMKGVAARYPLYDAAAGRVVNLENRINMCRTQHQGAEPLVYESDDMLGLSAYVAYQSRGLPVAGVIPEALRASFERGRERYRTRIGQMNLACMHCHQQNWGRTLLAQTISQGHGNAYPAYRLEWQSLGSLQRRLRACYFGVRAEMPPYQAAELLELEVYLAWRGRGLPIEAPGVRR